MDAIVQQAIHLANIKKKTSVPWKADQEYVQPFHSFESNEWKAQDLNTKGLGAVRGITKLALYSWNIDFMLPYPDSRMHRAISHLQTLIESATDSTTTANVIFLQECLDSDLKLIAADPWVRANFLLTDLDTTYWESGHYGTVSIIDRRLSISNCFRVHYSQTRMERDCLFADVLIDGRIIRLCNTHLESLALEPPYRPPQMKLAARYMHNPNIHGAVLAGDLNAIQDFDQHLHTDNDLQDAYLALGGREDSPAGHTWGQQAATKQRAQFGTSRMDKVFYCGDVEAKSFEKFGADVVVEDQAQQDAIVQLGFEKAWITDHLGVKAVFGVTRP